MDKAEVYMQVAAHIISQQESIIGPIAIERAKRVDGIEFDANSQVKIVGDPKDVISRLVNEYKTLFGQISVEVCREAAAPYIPSLSQEEIPAVLQ